MEINVFCGLKAISQVTHAIQESFTVHIEDLAYVFAVAENQIVENKRVV